MGIITALELKPYTLKELCQIYHLEEKVLRLNIKPIQQKLGKRIGQKYHIEQVIQILEHLELPAPFEDLETQNTKKKERQALKKTKK